MVDSDIVLTLSSADYSPTSPMGTADPFELDTLGVRPVNVRTGRRWLPLSAL